MNNTFNKITFIGYLTENAELKTFNSGKEACKLPLVTSKKFKNKETNEIKEEVCYIDAISWGYNAHQAKDLTKGSKVFLEGYLKFDTWEKDGLRYSKHRIYIENLMILNIKSNNNPIDPLPF